jgi:hypothetical protein
MCGSMMTLGTELSRYALTDGPSLLGSPGGPLHRGLTICSAQHRLDDRAYLDGTITPCECWSKLE